MTFYLQNGTPENNEGGQYVRVFLDDHLHPECELIKKIVADDWKAAREDAGWQ